MHFLITINRLNLSGSSTYTFTLASELRKKSHMVDVFTLFGGALLKKFKEKKIKVFRDLKKIKNKNYDCILAQHSIPALLIRSIFQNTPMIHISHGILPKNSFLEFPSSIDVNIQKYIAVSEEVRDNLLKNFAVPREKIKIIRNFVDTRRFFPKTKINNYPKRILLISNKIDKESYTIIKKACRINHAKLTVIGFNKSTIDIENYINNSDLVISLGRGILEAMSCGRAALVFDCKKGDGIITANNIDEIKRNNFSGRMYNISFNETSLDKEIAKYNKNMGEVNRKLILNNYSADKKVEELIKISIEARKEFIQKSISIPLKEILWLIEQIKKMEKVFELKSWKLYKKILSLYYKPRNFFILRAF